MNNMTIKYTRSEAQKLDSEDILKDYRNEFYINKDSVYMDGNSIGLLSKRAEQTALELLESWKTYAIDGWTDGKQPWFFLSESLGDNMSALVGAKKEEVIVTGSTTVNLHHLVARSEERSCRQRV